MSEGRQKISVYLKPETVEQIKKSGCKTNSEYMEKALEFYHSYMVNRQAPEFLSAAMFRSLKNVLDKTEYARSRALFKLSVEMAMMMNLLASMQDVDDVTLNRLRGECVKEVKRLNGSFSLDDAMRWQRG